MTDRKIIHWYKQNSNGHWVYLCNGAFLVNWQKTNMHGNPNCKNCKKAKEKELRSEGK